MEKRGLRELEFYAKTGYTHGGVTDSVAKIHQRGKPCFISRLTPLPYSSLPCCTDEKNLSNSGASSQPANIVTRGWDQPHDISSSNFAG